MNKNINTHIAWALEQLLSGRRLTNKVSVDENSNYRLSSTIGMLRKRGVPIITDVVPKEGGGYFGEYHLPKDFTPQ